MKKTLLFLATVLFQFNSFAQYTAIPDTNFEVALLIEGYDSGYIDHQVLTANINTITSLNVSSKSITDLTGIQNFVALQTLNCSKNHLTSLNLSGLTALTALNCHTNQLTSLNLSESISLTRLYCYANQLTSLNVSGLTALTDLWSGANQLTSLDVSGLTALTYLDCGDAQLTSLDVSGCTTLTTLKCYSNQLTSLNLSGLTALTDLICSGNQLTSLNLSGLIALTNLYCPVNPELSCIQVDNTAIATTNSSWSKDDTANYSLNCGLASNSYEFTKGVVVFPNPTQSILTLSTTTSIDKIIITDLTGKTVLHQTLPSNQVNMQTLAKGMYILQAFSGKEKYTTKFVKE